MPSPRRVLILGRPGAGKSTLARDLAARLELPCTRLDDWRRDERGRVPRDVLTARAEQLGATGSWIAEGLFITWTAPLMRAADLIVLLDPPRHVLVTRIWRRRRLDPDERREHGRWATIRFTWAAVRGSPLATLLATDVNLPPSGRAVREVLAPHAERVVTIRRRAAAAELRTLLGLG